MENDMKVEHFFLHSLFGSKLATQFMESLYTQRVQGQRSFVISDSTFSGLGRTGAAHLLPAQESSYIDLERQLNGLILMNLFGIPNTGAQLCSTNLKNPSLERLCAHYFSLSVISPVAFYSDKNNQSLEGHVFNFEDKNAKDSVYQSAYMRQRLNMYSREQLRKLEIFGGALIRPAFTEFQSLSKNFTDRQIDLTTLMFGEAILASYLFYDVNTNKTIELPKENNWVQLYRKNDTRFVKYQLQGGEQFTFSHTKDEIVGVQLFQKAGTVVVLQDNFNSTDSKRRPITLSVALRNDSQNNVPRARGHVFIEGATGTFLDNEYHEVYAENNIISFKQQDIYSQAINSQETQIDSISVAFSPIQGVNYACAIDKDLRTIKTLYVSSSADPKVPFTISPIKPNTERKPEDPFINIDDIAHVFFGKVVDPSISCESLMMGYKLIGNSTSADGLQYNAILRPNIMDMMPDMVTYQRLDIDITGNNSLLLKIQDTIYPVLSPLQSNKKAGDLNALDIALNISSILDEYTEKDYCFSIKLPHDIPFQQDFFSTCAGPNKSSGHFQLHHRNLGIFNFDLPNTNEKYISGLGERKGSFFLENSTTYAFYNNDNNVGDSYQAHSRKIVHGRNGMHNGIFAQHKTSKNSLAVIFGTTEGREITFGIRDKDPCFAVQSAVKEVYLQVYFDLKPDDLSRQVFQPAFTKQGKRVKIPPAWAFGHHMTVPSNMDLGLTKKLSEILDDLKFPLEGIIQDSQNLDQQQNSMSFDSTLFTAEAIKTIIDRNLSLVSVNTPTYPIAGRLPNDPNLGPIFNENIAITLFNEKRPYIDYSRGGRICYLNNLRISTGQVYLSVMDKFIADNNLNKFKFGLHNYQNEISRPMCTMDSCWEANFDREMDPLSLKLRKPGNQMMTYDTLDEVWLVFENETQAHNIEGETMNMLFQQKGVPNFLMAESTAFGSTIRGQVARIFDYFTSDEAGLPLAVQQLQAFSYQFGIPMVSMKFPRRPSLDGRQVIREMLLNTYSTSLSINQHYVDVKATLVDLDVKAFRLILRIKYSLLAYTRTQVFNQMKTGTPVIRPMYTQDLLTTAKPETTIGNMYMFGPSILAQPDFVYSGREYPYHVYCSAHGGISAITICFNNSVDSKYDNKPMVILTEGSITPLYSFNSTKIFLGEENFVGTDSIKNLTLDLHLFNNQMFNGTSKGQLLMDDGLGTLEVSSKWCFIEFEMIRENYTVVFSDVSQEQGQISQYNCSDMRSYQMNLVTLYGYGNFTDAIGNPMVQANITLKSNATVQLDLIEVDPKEAVGVFQVRGLPTGEIQTVNYFDIELIKFSSEVPAPPTVVQ